MPVLPPELRHTYDGRPYTHFYPEKCFTPFTGKSVA